jgi:hypothetical protein
MAVETVNSDQQQQVETDMMTSVFGSAMFDMLGQMQEQQDEVSAAIEEGNEGY